MELHPEKVLPQEGSLTVNALAAWLGTLIGAALEQCAGTIVGLVKQAVREAITDTLEEAKNDPELTARLRSLLPKH